MDKYVWIYGLKCPLTFQIRYVGYSKDPECRLWVHIYGNGGDSNRDWIYSLREQGLKPQLHYLERVPKAECYSADARWIHALKGEGHELTNKIYRGCKRPDIVAQYTARRQRRMENETR